MPGCATGIGVYVLSGENSSPNCCGRLAVLFPFQIPLPQPAASHLHRDCCWNNWSTQKRSQKRTSATCWASSSIPFFEETPRNPPRFERICNDLGASGIE